MNIDGASVIFMSIDGVQKASDRDGLTGNDYMNIL